MVTNNFKVFFSVLNKVSIIKLMETYVTDFSIFGLLQHQLVFLQIAIVQFIHLELDAHMQMMENAQYCIPSVLN